MDKQILINKARKLETRKDFLNLMNEIKSDLLGNKNYPFTMKRLLVLCNPKYNDKEYHIFEIPKKTGGVRKIYAPYGNLKWFQKCLNELFKALYTPSLYATGFTPGKSIVDNARMHTNQNYVFNVDLENFFPSIDQPRVWKRLQLEPFNFNANIASIMAGLCSRLSFREYDFFPTLPQGAPTSPLLANAICDTLDRRLHGLAKRFGLHYSRYADDITFSSMHNVYQLGSDFRKELERIISEQHFTINAKKTRLYHCSKRQEVTGLTVGTKINVPTKFVKDIRAILHIWEKYGYDAAYASFYPHYNSEKCQLQRGIPNLVNIISGKLCYLKMIKGGNDPVYTKLHAHFLRLIKDFELPRTKPTIEYLLTMSKDDFETKLGVKIEFKERVDNKKIYGCFYLEDRFFVVAVSKNLDINNLPDNVQVSLTRMLAPDECFYISSNDINDRNPKHIPMVTYIGYLLHKPLRGYHIDKEDNQIVSDKLKEFVANIIDSYPGMHFKDDYGIIDALLN
jgi:hypothetical protein